MKNFSVIFTYLFGAFCHFSYGIDFYGHRGFSSQYTENTLKSLEKCFLLNEKISEVVGAEIDIQLTSNNRVVVFHDKKINRLANPPPERSA